MIIKKMSEAVFRGAYPMSDGLQVPLYMGQLSLSVHELKSNPVVVITIWTRDLLEKNQSEITRFFEEKRDVSTYQFTQKIGSVIKTDCGVHLLADKMAGNFFTDVLPKIVRSSEREAIAQKYSHQMIFTMAYCMLTMGYGLEGKRDLDLFREENMSVDSQGNIQFSLADFAQLMRLQINSCAHGPTEVPMSVAPESVGGEYKFNTPQTNIFAFGKILFAMLSGCKAFDKQRYVECLLDIKNCTYRMSSEISDPDAQDLIEKIFVPDPKKRINLKGIITHPWFLKGMTQTILNGLLEGFDETSKKEVERWIQDALLKDKKNMIPIHGNGGTLSSALQLHSVRARIIRFLGSPVGRLTLNDYETLFSSLTSEGREGGKNRRAEINSYQSDDPASAAASRTYRS